MSALGKTGRNDSRVFIPSCIPLKTLFTLVHTYIRYIQNIVD